MVSPENYRSNRLYVTLVTLALVALTFICFGGNMKNYLFLDDTNAVFAGYLLSSDPGKIFSYNFPYIYGSSIWRFVVAFSYVPNYLLSGADPWSYYLANLFLHAGNGLLVFLLLERLGKNRTIACLAALLFTVSFQKTDALYWMASRTTMMGCFFYLLTLLLYCRLVEKGLSPGRLGLWLLSFAAAIGSYEVAFTLPATMLALGFVMKGREVLNRRDLVPIVLAAVAVAALIVMFRIGTASVGVSVLTETAPLPKALHAARNVLAVFPFFVMPPAVLVDLTNAVAGQDYYSNPARFGWLEYLSLGMVAGIALLNLKMKNRLIYFALLLFVVTMLPVVASRWSFYPGEPFNRLRLSVGRYSYLPSVGFYTIAAIYLHQLYELLCRRAPQKAALAAALTVMAAILAVNYSQIRERSQIWNMVNLSPKLQMTALAELNLPVKQFKRVAVMNFTNYHVHSLSLLRVLYKDPQLTLTEPDSMRDNPNMRLIGQSSAMAAFSDGQDLLLVGQ